MEIFDLSFTLTFKNVFWKTKHFFNKLDNCFLLESTTIEIATFPNKTTLLKTNIKTNRMGSANSIFHKKPSFSTKFFIFLKI